MKFDELRQLVDSGYPIRVDPVSELTLNYQFGLAEKALEGAEKLIVTVMISSHDRIYTGATADAEQSAQLIQKLKEQGDTQVTHLVTLASADLCQDKCRSGLDLPPYTFREMLVGINEKNAGALLLIQGHDSLQARTVGSTMY